MQTADTNDDIEDKLENIQFHKEHTEIDGKELCPINNEN
jgi:hypothetical protein